MPTPVSLIGYHPTFDAEMTTSADMAKFRTTFINGDRTLYTNHEAEEYVDNNPANPANPFAFANGALSITARPVPAGGHPYTSGMIQTADSFRQNQGFFEIRAQVPNVQGFWSAFWMLNSASYPEIDILEQPSNSGSSSKYWTQINTPSDYSGGFNDVGVDLAAGYHAYGFLWKGDQIQFTFDGQLIGYPHSTPPSLIGQQMYLLANLAVGDPYSWPGQPVDGATASYRIDYIRAFSADPTVAAVTMGPISSPDGVDTTPQLGTPQVPTPPALPVTIGAGADTFLFAMSEDAFAGDAQFTISVDGVQQGGVQTTTASHAAGQSQTFAVKGNFGSGEHTASVSFLNDAWGGSSAADRNLYVDAASFNGQALTPGNGALFSNGSLSFVRPGSTSDTLTLAMAEDAFQGDARAEISLDGRVLGQATVTAANSGTPQLVSFTGSFGAGPHTVGVNFLNDASGPGGDRNLYVKGVTFNGTAHPDAQASLYWNGAVNLNI